MSIAGPSTRLLEESVRAMAHDLKPGLQQQLINLTKDLKRLGASDQFTQPVLRVLIEEIRKEKRI